MYSSTVQTVTTNTWEDTSDERETRKKGWQSLALCTFLLESLLASMLLIFWHRNLLPLFCVSSLGCSSLAFPPLYLGKEKAVDMRSAQRLSPLLPGIPPA